MVGVVENYTVIRGVMVRFFIEKPRSIFIPEVDGEGEVRASDRLTKSKSVCLGNLSFIDDSFKLKQVSAGRQNANIKRGVV